MVLQTYARPHRQDNKATVYPCLTLHVYDTEKYPAKVKDADADADADIGYVRDMCVGGSVLVNVHQVTDEVSNGSEVSE